MSASKASSLEKVNDLFGVDIALATRLHIEYVIIQMAHQHYESHAFEDQNIRPVLDLLLKTFAVKLLMTDSECLYETGFFGRGSKRLIADAMKHLLVQLRPHMVPLAETPAFLDVVYTTIGNKWGDIYEAQLDFAKNSRLNKTKVPHYYQTLMKPVMSLR